MRKASADIDCNLAMQHRVTGMNAITMGKKM